MATADTQAVTVAERESWFREFDPARRPLWVWCDEDGAPPLAWLSLRSFYGRPAYRATVETAIYTSPNARRRGLGKRLLAHAISSASTLQINTLLAYVFAHNDPSLGLFHGAGFVLWGRLPAVAELDGIQRDLVILGRRIGAGATS